MNKLTIKALEGAFTTHGGKCEILLNDIQIRGVSDLTLHMSIGQMSSLDLCLAVEKVEIEIDGVATDLNIEEIGGKKIRVEGGRVIKDE